MTRVSKITLLAAILVVLAYVVGKLQLPGGAIPPPASVSGDATTSNASQSDAEQVRHQPTILQPRPALGGNGLRPGPSPREEEMPGGVEVAFPYRTPVPERPADTLPEIPRPEFPRNSWPVSRALSIPSPFQLDQLEAGRPPTQPIVSETPANVPPGIAPQPRWNHPASVRATESDSFWNISLRVYGVGDYYKALYYHNRELVRRPDMIDPGLIIVTPTPDELRRLYPNLCPP